MACCQLCEGLKGAGHNLEGGTSLVWEQLKELSDH